MNSKALQERAKREKQSPQTRFFTFEEMLQRIQIGDSFTDDSLVTSKSFISVDDKFRIEVTTGTKTYPSKELISWDDFLEFVEIGDLLDDYPIAYKGYFYNGGDRYFITVI
ncbi:hypothetical protein [Pseudomonas fluorescens]|uniref:Uncharacterized protein n=1 Tax=Pseudomonas fluorescens TaxID=294 RepID=A0A5E6RNI1_PSEFL|nr:hypothetical protein [Pseudomonas fluorescens]VVM69620.1 hypothetical protein PS655_01746 [Pseudomonas fluorescens]